MTAVEPPTPPPSYDNTEPDAPFDVRGRWMATGAPDEPDLDDDPEAQAAPPGGPVAGGVVGARAPVADRHNWVPVGPRNIGGRINAIAIHPTTPDIMFAGTAAGGVYRSNDHGVSWESLWHDQPSLAIGGLCISPANPDRVWVATGDPQPGGGGVIVGDGIYRSDDGGDTWHRCGGIPGDEPHPGLGFEAIAADPNDEDFAWAVGPAGAFRTPDGGQTWQHFRGTNRTNRFGQPRTTYFSDAVFSPHADGELYLIRIGDNTPRDERLDFAGVVIRLDDPRDPEATIRDILTEPASGDEALRDEWMVNDTLFGRTIRGRMAICRSQPEIGYVRWVGRDRNSLGVYRCDDLRVATPSAATWSFVDDHPDWLVTDGAGDPQESQGEYNLTIAVDPDDPQHVATGMVDLYVSHHAQNPAAAPGGNVWIRAMAWELHTVDRAHHADHHAIAIEGAPDRALWVGCDGGIMRSTDWRTNTISYAPKTPRSSGPQPSPPPPGVITWEKRSWGITTTLMYDLAQSPVIPTMYGCGFQDNGVWMTSGSHTWRLVLGGDGGFMAFDPDDPYQFFATWQGGIAQIEVPGRLDGRLPVPGDVANNAFWPRSLGQGFLATDPAAFVAESAIDPRRSAEVLTTRENRLYRWHRAGQGEAWSVEQVGRSIEIQADAPGNVTVTVLPSTAATKLGLDPRTVTHGTRARVDGLIDGPFVLAENDRLSMLVNGVAVDVDFTSHGAINVANLTAAQARDEIDAVLSGLTIAARCIRVGQRVEVQADAPPDAEAAVTVLPSTAAPKLGLEPQTVTDGNHARVRARRGGPYTLAPNDRLSLIVNGTTIHVDFTNHGSVNVADLTVAQACAEIRARLTGLATPARCEPCFWSWPTYAEVATTAASTAADAQTIAIGGTGLDRLGLSAGTYSGAVDHPAVVTIPAYSNLAPPTGGAAFTLTLRVNGGAVRTVTFESPRFADVSQIRPGELVAALTHALIDQPVADGGTAEAVTVLADDSQRGVTMEANAGTRLRFDGTAQTRIGLPAQTAVGGRASFRGPRFLAPTPLTLTISDQTDQTTINFHPQDVTLGIADLTAATAAELATLLRGAMGGSSVTGNVTVSGTDVRLQAVGGVRLEFSGTARTVLGLPNRTAVDGTATIATPTNVQATTALTLRIREGPRTANITFDAGLNVTDLRRVTPQELLRVLKGAMAGMNARTDARFRLFNGECNEIAHSASDPERIWVGGQDGTVARTSDGGANWRHVPAPDLLKASAPVEAIAVHPEDPDVVYVGLSGSLVNPTRATASAPDGHPPTLFRTDDDGATWTDIGAQVRDAEGRVVAINALAVDPAEPDAVYAGTHVGVFRSVDRGATWQAFNEGLPGIRVFDLLLEPATRTLRAAGWGRTIFERHVGTRPPKDVQLYVRASDLDDGTQRPPALGPEVFARQPASEVLTQSPDIKLTRDVSALAPISHGSIFDDDVEHQDPTPGNTNLAVQVHNAGAFEATQVRVVGLYADASVAPPALPDDFWTQYDGGTLSGAVGEWTAALDVTLPVDQPLPAADSRVVHGAVALPAGVAAFARLGVLVITSCNEDPIDTSQLEVAKLVLSTPRCAYRESPVDSTHDHDTLHIIGSTEDESTLFDVATAAPDPALARLGLAADVGRRFVTGGQAPFDLSTTGGPRGITITLQPRDITISFEAADIPRLQHVASWQVEAVLNREFIQARLPLRATVDRTVALANQQCTIEARGAVNTVSIVGGDARVPLGLPAPGGAVNQLQTAQNTGQGFDLRPPGAGPRTLTLRVHTSVVVRFDPAELGTAATARADQVRTIFNRTMREALMPVRAVVPRVDLRLRHSVSDADGPAVVTGRLDQADLVTSDLQINIAADQEALFALPATLDDDTLDTGINFLYLRSHNLGTADQDHARHRLWELRHAADLTDPQVTLTDIDSIDAHVPAGRSTIVEFQWTPDPAVVSGEIRLVVAAVDHPTDRPLDVPAQFPSLAAVHEFCHRHPGAAYREFTVR